MTRINFGHITVFCLAAILPALAQGPVVDWSECMRAGLSAYRDADYKLAEEKFKQCINLSGRSETAGRRLAFSQYQLGLVYLKEAKYEESERSLLAALKLQKGSSSQDESAIVRSLNALCDLYTAEKKYLNAMETLKVRKEIEEKLFAAGDLKLARTDHQMLMTMHAYCHQNFFERKMDQLPGFEDAMEKLVNYCGKESECFTTFRDALLRSYDDSMAAWKKKGQAQLKAGKERAARASFESGLSVEERRLRFCCKILGDQKLMSAQIQSMFDWNEACPDKAVRLAGQRMLLDCARSCLPDGDPVIAKIRGRLSSDPSLRK